MEYVCDIVIDESKLAKLNGIKKLGINPYPYLYPITSSAKQILLAFDEFDGKVVQVAGRIIGRRDMGKLTFIDILDASAKIQILVKANSMENDSIKILEFIDIGDIIGVKGTVVKTKKGEISIDAKEIVMLSKSLATFPEKFHGLTDVEIRYRKRYLDLIMNTEVREIFKTRAAFIKYIREFLDNKGYLEVETPILQPTYGGANAKPFVTHHHALNADLYLRVANELYLKKLIIGGFEKVYEFSKDFRNEDIDTTHNPEFTQIELYEAYSDYNIFAKLTEDLLSGFVQKFFKNEYIEYQGQQISFAAPFKRILLTEEIFNKTGIDILKMSEADAFAIAEKEKLQINIKNRYHVVDALFDKYIKPNLISPTFVFDFPAYMCPLAKNKRGNEKLSERFELYVSKFEVANCYSELTDPIEQRKKFEEQEIERKTGDEEAPPTDNDFLEAIEYGMPPTAGIGISIDRFVMIFTNNPSIKETILFPSVRTEKQENKNA
jgi:lysyl-tRNA synthetase class 2